MVGLELLEDAGAVLVPELSDVEVGEVCAGAVVVGAGALEAVAVGVGVGAELDSSLLPVSFGLGGGVRGLGGITGGVAAAVDAAAGGVFAADALAAGADAEAAAAADADADVVAAPADAEGSGAVSTGAGGADADGADAALADALADVAPASVSDEPWLVKMKMSAPAATTAAPPHSIQLGFFAAVAVEPSASRAASADIAGFGGRSCGG